jgi:hypothetical protein
MDKTAKEFNHTSNKDSTGADSSDTLRRGISHIPVSHNLSKIEDTLNSSSNTIRTATNKDDRGFSISNIKHSLFSKISNIFTNNITEPDQTPKPKGPKY